MKKRGMWLGLYFFVSLISLCVLMAILGEAEIKIGSETFTMTTIATILGLILYSIYAMLLDIHWRCQLCGEELPLIGLVSGGRCLLPDPSVQSCPKCDTDIC